MDFYSHWKLIFLLLLFYIILCCFIRIQYKVNLCYVQKKHTQNCHVWNWHEFPMIFVMLISHEIIVIWSSHERKHFTLNSREVHMKVFMWISFLCSIHMKIFTWIAHASILFFKVSLFYQFDAKITQCW